MNQIKQYSFTILAVKLKYEDKTIVNLTRSYYNRINGHTMHSFRA